MFWEKVVKILTTTVAFLAISPFFTAGVHGQFPSRTWGTDKQHLPTVLARDEQLNRLGKFTVFYNRFLP